MTNKICLFTLLLVTGVFGLQAQNENEDDLNISVVVPVQMNGLTSGQTSKLHSRMLRMVSNYGISGEGYTEKFIMYPKYEIYDHKVVEGLRNVHLIEVELSLIVKEVKTGKVYSVYSQEITGDGYSKNEAIDQSISQIKTKGDAIENFLQSAKTKILDYYRSNCDRLYSEADTMISQKRYSEAIALLYPVPKEVGGDCYEKIQRKLDEAYKGYLNKTCEKNLVMAKAEISKNNNETALEILASIETESNCHTSAQQLKAKIVAKTKNNEDAGENESSQSEISASTENDKTEEIEDTQKAEVVETKETSTAQKRTKMKSIAQTEFKRSRHQMEIERAMEEG
ncbi:hypothetical protein U1E44_03455 [Arenibacter sp. GZD96]|uniref:hypothetical protein n=1 Tax=Aurantibrevibacter litoralis TaxID=3106030 RepID=UPI002AFF82A2|nr:hypothetical protein [Arenibacter sp. GZD-96]MEA1785135.1 hypothetical protein [Arenibacter sp. GZD-96]